MAKKTQAIKWESTDVVETLMYTIPLDQTGLVKLPGNIKWNSDSEEFERTEPSILQNYTVSNNVQFHIVDTPGGYSLQLVLDNEVVYKEEFGGGILGGESRRVVNLPIIAAIKKEKESV